MLFAPLLVFFLVITSPYYSARLSLILHGHSFARVVPKEKLNIFQFVKTDSLACRAIVFSDGKAVGWISETIGAFPSFVPFSGQPGLEDLPEYDVWFNVPLLLARSLGWWLIPAQVIILLIWLRYKRKRSSAFDTMTFLSKANIMDIGRLMVRFVLVAVVAGCCMLPLSQAGTSDSNAQVPSLIRDGFSLWAKKGVSYAFDAWKIGGLMEDDSKPAALAKYFGRMDRAVGNFKSYEVIETKCINSTSQIIYLSLNFERAAVYGRFLLYRTDKDWVVQNMDFSTKPEAVMPWLAFAGSNYGE